MQYVKTSNWLILNVVPGGPLQKTSESRDVPSCPCENTATDAQPEVYICPLVKHLTQAQPPTQTTEQPPVTD